MSNAVKYSIVIPTRERHETLSFAIRSCLSIRRDDVEIVVCDNASSPETKQVVDSIGGERLKYIRSEDRLNMADNWDLAMSMARGEFVTVLGDDDAVVAEVLDRIEVILRSCEVVTWFRTPYFWPKRKAPSNVLVYTTSEYERVFNGSMSLEYVLRTFCNYQFYPSFYNSFISKSTIAKIRLRHAGKLYPSGVLSPDVYSVLDVLATVDKYCLISTPFSLSGISRCSNGGGNRRELKRFIHEYGAKKVHALYSDDRLPRYQHISLGLLSDYLLFIAEEGCSCCEALIKSLVGNYVAKSKGQLPRWVVRELLSHFKVEMADVVVDETDGIGSYLPAHRGVLVDGKKYGITDACKAAAVYGQLMNGMLFVPMKTKTPRNRYWYGAKIRRIPILGRMWARYRAWRKG